MKNKLMIEANKTLETEAIETLINHITGEALKDIRERFAKVKEAKKYAEHSGVLTVSIWRCMFSSTIMQNGTL
jgi:DNA-binding GntR family transcriptional regulator